MKPFKKIIALVILTAASLAILSGCQNGPPRDGQYAQLAQCLNEKGVKFYGTFWCHFCKKQKEIFGDDFRYIAYVECDDRDENGDAQACLDAGITSYPSWFFPGQGVEVGVQQPGDLAKKANCESALPAEESQE